MQQKSFGNLIWSSLLETWGIVVAVLSFVALIASYFVVPAEDNIGLRWYVVTVFFAAFLIAVFARAAWIAQQQMSPPSPKVRYAKDPPKAFPDAVALFLLEPTSLLAQGALVSIYYLENEIEKLVGLGEVINVQNDGKVQVLVVVDYEFGEKINEIKSNSPDELKKLVVKNTIPGFILEGQNNV